MSKYVDLYIIKLKRDLDNSRAASEVVDEYLAYNTWKFFTPAAALAYCRKRDLDPKDYIICKARFLNPKILETIEIDYSETKLDLAK